MQYAAAERDGDRWPMELVMTLLVRDEEDTVAANMDYHLAMGVDHIVVTDNLSVDRTPEILKGYERSGVATYIHEPSDDYNQRAWVKRMADLAHGELRARWIMHTDADEFWMTTDGSSLKDFFRSVRFSNIVEAPRHDFVYASGNDDVPFHERMIHVRTRSLNPLGKPLEPKVAHRGAPDLRIAQGNHAVNGFRWPRKLKSGLEILHFPLRSREQYFRKITNGGRAYERNTVLPKHVGGTWRKQYHELMETGTLRFVDENTWSEESLARGLANGTLREDTRLRDFMRSIAKG